MKRLIFLLTFIIFNLNAQDRASGLVFDDNAYQTTSMLGIGFNFSSNSLKQKSLKQYCPTPRDQGDVASCVGWSAAYAALTISKAVKDNITDIKEINKMALSPHYLYNHIKIAGCIGGSKFSDALEFLTDNGVCSYAEYNNKDCEEIPPIALKDAAQENKIKDFGKLFNIEDSPQRKIDATIVSLDANKPIVIGINFTKSLANLQIATWKPKPSEQTIGGHAVTVIGYDSEKKVFEIMNSWGVSWGNQGFFEISFDNYAKYVKYGYQLILDSKVIDKGEIQLSGDFIFKKYSGFDNETNSYLFKELAPSFNNDEYSFPDGSIKLGDFFQLEAKNTKQDSYVYIFSLKPNGETEVLFPEKDVSVDKFSKNKLPKAQKAMVFGSNMTINIPEAKDEALETDQTGTDILCILYSYYEIPDIHSRVNALRNSESNEFKNNLKKVFKNELINENSVKYNPKKMNVNVSSIEGTIVPIILKVNVN